MPFLCGTGNCKAQFSFHFRVCLVWVWLWFSEYVFLNIVAHDLWHSDWRKRRGQKTRPRVQAEWRRDSTQSNDRTKIKDQDHVRVSDRYFQHELMQNASGWLSWLSALWTYIVEPCFLKGNGLGTVVLSELWEPHTWHTQCTSSWEVFAVLKHWRLQTLRQDWTGEPLL